MKDILFNPSFEKYKTPLGALNSFEVVILNIFIKNTYRLTDFYVVVYDEDMEVLKRPLEFTNYEGDYNHYKVSFTLSEPYIYWYYFEFNDCYGKHFIGRDESLDAKLYNSHVIGFQLNVKYRNYHDYNWYQGKVMYQILVDRFYKGGNNPSKKDAHIYKSWDDDVMYQPVNGVHAFDFYGGDLQGVIKKLPYLKELNIGVIYFNPIFLAPTYHKYNTSDYNTIDPMYGTDDDLKNLCIEAAKVGISIILDGVFNHTGDDSIYFNKYNHFTSIGAYQDKASPYYSWYTFNEYPNDYRSWWGIKTLPSVNQQSSFISFITNENGIIDKWMKCGIKGFRLDVVDELNDDFIKKISKAIKRTDRNNIVIGEVWEDATNKISYSKRRTYFNGEQLDSVMNYVIKDAIIDYLKNDHLSHLVYKMREEINNYPKENRDLLMNILSTHDTARILTMFSLVNESSLKDKEKASYKMDSIDYDRAKRKVKMALIILYMLPGIPCIYYGDEIGMEGYRDPYCRHSFTWNEIDNDILSLVKKLGRIREDDTFIDGEYLEGDFDIMNNVFIFSRINLRTNKKYTIIINNSKYEYNYYDVNHNGYDCLEEVNIQEVLVISPLDAKIIKY